MKSCMRVNINSLSMVNDSPIVHPHNEGCEQAEEDAEAKHNAISGALHDKNVNLKVDLNFSLLISQ